MTTETPLHQKDDPHFTLTEQQQPLALCVPSIFEFLHFIFTQHRKQHPTPQQNQSTTTLIICSSKSDFTHLLEAQFIQPLNPPHIDSRLQAILTPTLSLLSLTSEISLVFTPTIQHFRAYISSLPPQESSSSRPLLAIWGLVEAHFETPEFSAQGIGRTVAGVVSAGARTGRWVVVGALKAEKSENGSEQGEGEMQLEELGERVNMDSKVPVLNSTINSKFGGQIAMLGRRNVSVRHVLERWFIWKDDYIPQQFFSWEDAP